MEKNVEKITSRSNPVCLHVKKLGKSKNYRDEHKQFLCDGEKLLSEAISAGAQIEVVLSSSSVLDKLSENIRVYHVEESMMDSLSPLKSPQDLLFVCSYPQLSVCNFQEGTHVLLDGVQDPGNVGTILRSAYAFGIKSVILTEGCADIYNPKTIRASMGAIFKQRVYTMSNDEISNLKQSGAKLIGAENKECAIDITKADLSNSIIMLGNEGQGISKELLTLCDEMVKIPISTGSESLNVAVAGSIIMWEVGGRICRH